MLKFGQIDWKDAKRGEENCFLLTNGLGGYCSMALTGAVTRDDHAFFMGAEKAPNFRYHYITNLHEKLELDCGVYDLASQSYATFTRNQHGYRYLVSFSHDELPEWIFQVKGITIRKTIVMVQNQNTIGVRYEITAPEGTNAVLRIRPLLKFAPKNHQPQEKQNFFVDASSVSSSGKSLYYRTDGRLHMMKEERIRDLFFAYDARDGRDSIGTVVTNHEIVFDIVGGNQEMELAYSDRAIIPSVSEMIQNEKGRLAALNDLAGFTDSAARRLVLAADQFLVKRDSTGGDTIIAGYPFFGDWGRDTMIALLGCVIETRQFERARSILSTFASYCKNGLMPNLFPEGEDAPMYNTVDASLWFIEAVYEYLKASGDVSFVNEMLPVMDEIISSYVNGTDYHIFMDSDGLISAGEGLEQVTWMDVRYGDILPTPRHGKPVEVNALWYNALCIMDELSPKENKDYHILAEKTKESFLAKFWMEEKGYLRDVLPLEEERAYAAEQIRCNQVWALSLPYSMLDQPKALRVLDTIEKELYTSNGLRTLSMDDPEFSPICCGDQYVRDLAYHQGTVWVYPMGAYIKAILRWRAKEEGVALAGEKLEIFAASLREGCIGQSAEIYDGAYPTESRGCYAQAWSVGEMLSAWRKYEEMKQDSIQ